jgi:hypothetical protein
MPIDYSKYCKDWKTRSRFVRFVRSGNRCERCRVANGALILRGKWKGQAVYQDDDGIIYCADTGRRVGDAYVGEVCESPKSGFTKVVLTVAHLDHDINNNSLFNLAAMCQRCHLKYDAKHHAANAAETRRRKKKQHKIEFPDA